MTGKILFSWLHLSDIHFGHGSTHYQLDQKEVWRKLTQDVVDALKTHFAPRPSKIFITGDLAFSGAGDEYQDLGIRLRDFARNLDLLTSDILAVPGNHDVQRGVAKNRDLDALCHWRDTGDLDTVLAIPENRKLLASRFANFTNFCREYAFGARGTWWSQPIKTKRLPIRVVGLNTAMLSNDDEDMGKLALGFRQLEETLPSGDGELVIALTHHPLSGWLSDGDRIEARLRSRTHIHLHGHVHEPCSLVTKPGGGSEWLQICASAAHTDEASPEAIHGYSFGAIGVDESDRFVVEIWPRRWDRKNARFCVDSDNADPYASSACHILDRPRPSALVKPVERTISYRVRGEPVAEAVFDRNTLGGIVAEIDPDMTRRASVADESLHMVAKRFQSLFFVEEENLDAHPLFAELNTTLHSLVPGIVLNEEDGILRRANTRHAILRTQTLHAILGGVEHGKLRLIALEIGRSAARDLISNVLYSGRHVPATASDFVALWDFWDRTGGWGKLSMPGAELEDGKRVWQLHVINNFLEVDRERRSCGAEASPEVLEEATRSDLEATHDLCEFWCGYIHGFLDESLPRIREIMLSTSVNDSRGVFIPAYSKVESVTHENVHDQSTSEDVFSIRFVPEPLSEAIGHLSTARRVVGTNKSDAMTYLVQAVHLSASEFPDRFSEVVVKLEDPARRERLLRMQTCLHIPPGYERMGTAEEWLEDANWMIKGLSR